MLLTSELSLRSKPGYLINFFFRAFTKVLPPDSHRSILGGISIPCLGIPRNLRMESAGKLKSPNLGLSEEVPSESSDCTLKSRYLVQVGIWSDQSKYVINRLLVEQIC